MLSITMKIQLKMFQHSPLKWKNVPYLYKFLSTLHQSHNQKVLLLIKAHPPRKFKKTCKPFRNLLKEQTHTQAIGIQLRVNRVTFEKFHFYLYQGNLCTNKWMVPILLLQNQWPFLREQRNGKPGYRKETSPCSGKCLSIDLGLMFNSNLEN